MQANIVVLAGDGIGPEVTSAAVRVMTALAEAHGHRFNFHQALIGAAAMNVGLEPLPVESLAACRDAHAVLLGAVGDPRYSDPNAQVRPEQGLLALRKALELYANLRPVVPHPGVRDASPIKADRLEGVDLLVVRELTGGMYFGEKSESPSAARDVCDYTAAEVERIARMACELARARGGRLTSVDKANVLATSRLWRGCLERIVAEEFPDVSLEHMLVDAAAMHLLQRPADFDVLVTENLFGDILTDEASVLAGSMGMLPSASLGEGTGLYEPIHGSAPDIAGRGIANPYGTILSCAMLLRHSLALDAEASALERAVSKAIDDGVRTIDIASEGRAPVGTVEAADAVIAALGATA